MATIKRSSSTHINQQNWFRGKYHWQEGYGAFSYSRSQLANVYRYIENQETHHKEQSFRQEYINLLERFKIEYNEKARSNIFLRPIRSLKRAKRIIVKIFPNENIENVKPNITESPPNSRGRYFTVIKSLICPEKLQKKVARNIPKTINFPEDFFFSTFSIFL